MAIKTHKKSTRSSFGRKRFKATKRHEPSPQAEMLDPEFGDPKFNYEKYAKVVGEDKKRVVISNMQIRFEPTPQKPIRACLWSIEAIRRFSRAYRNLDLSIRDGDGNFVSEKFELWNEMDCVCEWIQFRVRGEQETGISAGVVVAKHIKEERTLNLSLPHQSRWKESGLGWIESSRYCCDRSRANQMPWLGPVCGCEHQDV